MELMVKAHHVASLGEARRLVQQGAVKVNGRKVTDTAARFDTMSPITIRTGKKKKDTLAPALQDRQRRFLGH